MQTTLSLRPRWGVLALTVLLVALTGCTMPRYTKPDFTQAAWQRDHYECERDARMAIPGMTMHLADAFEAREFLGRCLAARGYVRSN